MSFCSGLTFFRLDFPISEWMLTATSQSRNSCGRPSALVVSPLTSRCRQRPLAGRSFDASAPGGATSAEAGQPHSAGPEESLAAPSHQEVTQPIWPISSPESASMTSYFRRMEQRDGDGDNLGGDTLNRNTDSKTYVGSVQCYK